MSGSIIKLDNGEYAMRVAVLGPNGLTFATGIGYRLVTDNADNGTTAVAAAAVLGMNIYYT